MRVIFTTLFILVSTSLLNAQLEKFLLHNTQGSSSISVLRDNQPYQRINMDDSNKVLSVNFIDKNGVDTLSLLNTIFLHEKRIDYDILNYTPCIEVYKNDSVLQKQIFYTQWNDCKFSVWHLDSAYKTIAKGYLFKDEMNRLSESVFYDYIDRKVQLMERVSFTYLQSKSVVELVQKKIVKVASMKEFLAALAPNREIEFTMATFNIDEIQELPDSSTYYTYDYYTGSLMLRNLHNFSISGLPSSKTSMTSSSISFANIKFKDCSFLQFKNISVPEDILNVDFEKYGLSSLEFNQCENISLSNCTFSGRNAEFLKINHGQTFSFNKVGFSKSQEDFLWVDSVVNIEFSDCLFENNSGQKYALFTLKNCYQLRFNRCNFSANKVQSKDSLSVLFDLQGCDNVSFTNNRFVKNEVFHLMTPPWSQRILFFPENSNIFINNVFNYKNDIERSMPRLSKQMNCVYDANDRLILIEEKDPKGKLLHSYKYLY